MWEVAVGVARDVSIVFAALSAIFGIGAWRREYRGKRQIELAEDVLAMTYEIRDVIRAVRSAYIFGDEARDIRRGDGEPVDSFNNRQRAAAVAQRLEERAPLFSRFSATKYRYMATFGTAAARPFDEIDAVRAEIRSAANMIQTSWVPTGEGFTADRQSSYIKDARMRAAELFVTAEPTPTDPFDRRVQTAVEATEKTCHRVSGEFVDRRFIRWIFRQ